MATLERAVALAATVHDGQRDKAGQAYILHPLRVMMSMTTDEERMVAVLHDVVEDTDVTLDGLREQGFSEDVVRAVDCLTKRRGEGYPDFIQRVATDPLARLVKLADLEDNLNLLRLGFLDEKALERMDKYHRAWALLRQGEGWPED